MIYLGLRSLAAADVAAMPDAVKAECLHGYERAAAVLTAGRAWILGSYTAGQGYSADAEYSAGAWLRHRTKVTKAVARAHVAWARRAAAHPGVIAALAEGTVLTELVARAICGWTDRLPADCRLSADAILVAAARAGADDWDLAGLAAEIYARSLPPDDDGPEDGFGDRGVRLETTFVGAGVIAGDLTPECGRWSAPCWRRCPRRTSTTGARRPAPSPAGTSCVPRRPCGGRGRAGTSWTAVPTGVRVGPRRGRRTSPPSSAGRCAGSQAASPARPPVPR